MVIVGLLLLAAFGRIFVLFGARAFGRVLYVLAAAAFLATACGPAAQWMADDLQAGYATPPAIDWSRRSVIVVLGAGTEKPPSGPAEVGTFAYPRLFKALELYTACRRAQGPKCTILASGGDPQRHGASEAATYVERYAALGIDPADLLVEGASLNTWQNAEFVKPMLATAQAEQVVLVTSGVHLRRSLLYFAHFGISAIPVRADYLAPGLGLPSAGNIAAADLALHELVGIWRYELYNRMGWNPPAARAGAP